jgi:threonylcarbamoyladenosine tRNA methylthiotransferase MtaB
MTVFFHTLGCKVNQYESEEMLEALSAKGFSAVSDPAQADIIVINSCTVTAESDRKSRQSVRHLKSKNPDAIIVLTGCMPQAYSEKTQALPEADIVLGNKTNYMLADAIDEYLKKRERIIRVEPHRANEPLKSCGINRFEERTRAFLKIEDGCNRFCSYCAIPYARGRVRSKPVKDIVSEASALAKNGFVEIVLVGINLSAYGSDLNGQSFPEAVRAVSDIPEVKRVRLGSLEPDHITDEVIKELSQVEKLCPQFHISLQSGSNNTLERMNRHYTADEYYSLCQKLRSTFDGCTLTTDIMVGFSGETEADFSETVEFVKKVGFEKVHIFPYSVREGTRAAQLGDRITKDEKARRAKILADVCNKIRSDYLLSCTGKSFDILVEQKLPDGFLFGYTANYIPVRISPQAKMTDGKYTITRSDGEYCYAE